MAERLRLNLNVVAANLLANEKKKTSITQMHTCAHDLKACRLAGHMAGHDKKDDRYCFLTKSVAEPV